MLLIFLTFHRFHFRPHSHDRSAMVMGDGLFFSYTNQYFSVYSVNYKNRDVSFSRSIELKKKISPIEHPNKLSMGQMSQ